MRGATYVAQCSKLVLAISIHAPHARSDRTSMASSRRPLANFNPRSSCEERPITPSSMAWTKIFQSTLLMRGATRSASPGISPGRNFNPRSSCEERHEAVFCQRRNKCISIHAPHARSDRGKHRHQNALCNFNPRSSCEERPLPLSSTSRLSRFQSTLLMRGATPNSLIVSLYCLNFNPRSSCEERPDHL